MKIADIRLLVVDTETTGLNYTAGDRIVEFAASNPYHNDGSDEMQMLVNPGRPIPAAASAVHGITDADVAGAPSLDEASERIRAFVGDAILIAHNAVFDRSMLPCLADRRWLCTKRLAHHLFPDLPRFNNQELRQHFGGVDLDLRGQSPHRAMADVIVTSFVLGHLIERWFADGHPDDVEALIAFAERPIAYRRIPFGKYNRRLISDIPSDYLRWMLGNTRDLGDDLRSSIERELMERKVRV